MMKKNAGYRARCRVLCLVVALMLLPAFGSLAEVTHGVVTMDKVFLRPKAGAADFIDRLHTGWAAEILGTQTVDGVLWYKVKTNTPTFPNRTYEAYIHGNFFRLMTEAEQAAWLANPVQASLVPAASTSPAATGNQTQPPDAVAPAVQGIAGYLKITAHNTNLRDKPGGSTLVQLPKGLVTAYYGAISQVNGYSWAFI